MSDPGYDADDARCSRTRGVIIVAAAGNDGSNSVLEYPAAESSQRLAAVGASNSSTRVAGFSNFGSWVRFIAPGDQITSSVPGGGYGNVGAVALGNTFNTGTQTPAWTDRVHRSLGNVLLSDGSAQQLSSSGLRTLLRNTGDTSAAPSSPGPNTILFPN
jgi:hypothetical protein